MTQAFRENTLTRREALKGMGAIAGAAAAVSVLPVAARAAIPAISSTKLAASDVLASPPAASAVAASNQLAASYLSQLQGLPGLSSATLPDTLYALNCTTRPDITLGSVTLTATSYVDAANPPAAGAVQVGPTMVFERGQTTGVWFNNSMSVCGPINNVSMMAPDSGWRPHGFTMTNLHTHGLHVTPQPPSDDVLLMIRSTTDSDPHVIDQPTSFPYFYTVPADHPVGTFWYHPHKHGAVASQVGPGMSGALIVRGKAGDGDIDDLLASQCNITAADEIVAVMQTIDYYYTNPAKTQAVFYPAGYYIGGEPAPSTCLDQMLAANTNGTPTSINGQLNPTVSMDIGQIVRLRLVNASNGQTYIPKFKYTGTGTAPVVPDVYAIAVDGIALLPRNPAGTAPYYKIDYSLSAKDSAYYTTAELITLAPGQRVDLLIKANAAGTFELYGAGLGEAPTVVENNTPNTSSLMTFVVSSTKSTKNQSLPTEALFATGTIQRPEVPDSLPASGSTITVPSSMPVATQTLEFKTVDSAFNASGVPTAPAFLINDQHFDGDPAASPQLQLYKGDSDVWNLYSSNDAHIFHIHINSFAAFARVPYDTTNRGYEAPVYYQMPIWRDTIYFDAGTPDTESNFVPGTMVVAASKQVDFTGEFVLHCHNLFHEDNGMMLSVAILDPETGGYDKT